MMTWILTSAVIAAFSIALLRLFDENTRPETSNEHLDESNLSPARFSWETMTEADLDALLTEFCAAGETPLMRKPN